jgi:hypothetical protein
MTTATKRYDYTEAYCLMKYRTKDGTEEEFLWNSRDGVTPFGIMSRSGKELFHVEWRSDKCVPNHVPKIGDRIFVDLTKERAEECARINVDRMWDAPNYPMSQAGYGSKENAAAILAENYVKNAGEPDVIEVTQEWLNALNGDSK